MTVSKHTLGRALCCWGIGLSWPLLACKDDSPCDEGQELRNSTCYVVAGASGTGGGGDGDGTGGMDGGVGSDSAVPDAIDAEVGQPCTDTTASSDCGGGAPICAPLPSGTACTQILCLDGEANAGACPTGWTCLQALPLPDPSVCLNF